MNSDPGDHLETKRVHPRLCYEDQRVGGLNMTLLFILAALTIRLRPSSNRVFASVVADSSHQSVVIVDRYSVRRGLVWPNMMLAGAGVASTRAV